MERVGTLINKLQEQFINNASTEQLLQTVQLLAAELNANSTTNAAKGKVAVTMPALHAIPNIATQASNNNISAAIQEPTKPEVANPTVHHHKKTKQQDYSGWLFEPEVAAVPTLVHQEITIQEPEPIVNEKQVFELKDVLADETVDTASLNDKLKIEQIEVATVLQSSPVKDLKKAIGINDRYLFINELFRGDEDMYERSIKTINSFNIQAEAEYWIQRELKVKLGWMDDSEAVKTFDQLIKRRFS